MGYTGQTIKGFSFLALLRIITRILSLVKNLIIARVLSPSQFGAFGIAILVLVFAEIITETGVNTFLIQNKEETNQYIDTSWLVSIIRGLVIFLLIIIFSPWISLFF
ncbi:MAG TPA: oligosaccharide flippase family protein, partial [Patescibacteria group bacterium]|nr:oligosaccharide flippase family protein [Patescibacteria group bacterium]